MVINDTCDRAIAFGINESEKAAAIHFFDYQKRLIGKFDKAAIITAALILTGFIYPYLSFELIFGPVEIGRSSGWLMFGSGIHA